MASPSTKSPTPVSTSPHPRTGDPTNKADTSDAVVQGIWSSGATTPVPSTCSTCPSVRSGAHNIPSSELSTTPLTAFGRPQSLSQYTSKDQQAAAEGVRAFLPTHDRASTTRIFLPPESHDGFLVPGVVVPVLPTARATPRRRSLPTPNHYALFSSCEGHLKTCLCVCCHTSTAATPQGPAYQTEAPFPDKDQTAAVGLATLQSPKPLTGVPIAPSRASQHYNGSHSRHHHQDASPNPVTMDDDLVIHFKASKTKKNLEAIEERPFKMSPSSRGGHSIIPPLVARMDGFEAPLWSLANRTDHSATGTDAQARSHQPKAPSGISALFCEEKAAGNLQTVGDRPDQGIQSPTSPVEREDASVVCLPSPGSETTGPPGFRSPVVHILSTAETAESREEQPCQPKAEGVIPETLGRKSLYGNKLEPEFAKKYWVSEETVGTGGTAIVLRGQRRADGLDVAIKFAHKCRILAENSQPWLLDLPLTEGHLSSDSELVVPREELRDMAIASAPRKIGPIQCGGPLLEVPRGPRRLPSDSSQVTPSLQETQDSETSSLAQNNSEEDFFFLDGPHSSAKRRRHNLMRNFRSKYGSRENSLGSGLDSAASSRPTSPWPPMREQGTSIPWRTPPAPIPLEIYILKHLSHPALIGYLDHFQDENYIYLVMEIHGPTIPWSEHPPSKDNKTPPSAGYRHISRNAIATQAKARACGLGSPSLLPVPGLVDLSKSAPTKSTMLGESYGDSMLNGLIELPYEPPVPLVRTSRDLFECIDKHGVFSEERARIVFKQIASCVRYLHDHGVCHMDLKDENVLLDENFSVRLIDFGSAAFSDTHILEYHGTSLYRCPESISGSHRKQSPESLSRRQTSPSAAFEPRKADSWALGVLLFVMLHRIAPFPSGDPWDIRHKTLSDDLLRPDLSVECREVLLDGLLVKDPGKRWDASRLLEAAWLR